jgi:hypothetical protein
MITGPPICIYCRHFNEADWSCPAFPNGIPPEIIDGGNDHARPLGKEYPTFEKAEGVTDEQLETWQEMSLEQEKVELDLALEL